MKIKERTVLIFYSPWATNTGTVADHLSSFADFSKFRVLYANAVNSAPCDFDLECVDAVLVHYSVRLIHPNFLSEEIAQNIERFSGPKFLFIQDEYENMDQTAAWIQRLKFDVIFTCVPDKFIQRVYPPEKFPGVKFVNNLTGYIPDSLGALSSSSPMADRKIVVGYRGRALHPVFGRLAWEKQQIGFEFRKRAEGANIKVDIEWSEESRIYGDRWPLFISSCRAVLVTESGSNVFQPDRSLMKKIDAALEDRPQLSFDEIEEQFLRGIDGALAQMEQISPRVFEAIALRTGLVGYEGEYSGILKPWRHYIPLKRDFSNFNEVVDYLSDDRFMIELVETSYGDIVASRKYSYSTFVNWVDSIVEDRIRHSPAKPVPKFKWWIRNRPSLRPAAPPLQRPFVRKAVSAFRQLRAAVEGNV